MEQITWRCKVAVRSGMVMKFAQRRSTIVAAGVDGRELKAFKSMTNPDRTPRVGKVRRSQNLEERSGYLGCHD